MPRADQQHASRDSLQSKLVSAVIAMLWTQTQADGSGYLPEDPKLAWVDQQPVSHREANHARQ